MLLRWLFLLYRKLPGQDRTAAAGNHVANDRAWHKSISGELWVLTKIYGCKIKIIYKLDKPGGV